MVTILLFMALAHQMVKSSLAAGEEIRLVNGTSRCSGTVEILYEGQWGRVCGQKWDVNDANVVCGQLGCGRAVSVQGSVHLGQGSGGRPTWLDDVGCNGSESSLTECSHGGLKHHDCLQSQDARVVCSVKPNIRLVNGSDLCSGRVEVYKIGHWRTVCNDMWDLNVSAVACRQLGCGNAVSAPERAYFGQGSGPIWQDDVGCSGSECSITQCPHTGGTHNCNHGNDAGVICSGVVLQKPSLSTNQSYSAFLHGEEVQLTCTLPSRILCNAVEFIFYLNGDSVMNVTVGSSQPRATLTKFKMDASHQGSYRCLYRTLSNSQVISSPYSNVTEVVLLQPNISLSPPNGGMFWEPQGPVVIRGHSFSITCSIQPQYPGGLFYLDFSGFNRTETKPAVNHSASFHFPVAEYKDQGNYSCSYVVNVSTPSFRSANRVLAVTIRAVLLQPNISLSAPNGGMFWGLQGPEVTRGHSFSITCSIQPQYLGGLFYLEFSGSNRTEPKPAVNHSAYFHFPVAEYTDQGNYSCVYEVNVSNLSFHSIKTELLTVSIRASIVPIIASGAIGGLLLLLLLLIPCLVWRKISSREQSIMINLRETSEENDEEDYVNVETFVNKSKDEDLKKGCHAGMNAPGAMNKFGNQGEGPEASEEDEADYENQDIFTDRAFAEDVYDEDSESLDLEQLTSYKAGGENDNEEDDNIYANYE
ncbi:uncharacterized protein LOC115170986 isoform X2 [Salmo trutta]|uniref:uncharacterized protein LOC115170986 isoform X2 n=1 Tax=Salmo trutta TaxID=8032 RepID=UPI00113006D8|nr:uncharacterized protein LOC115170986 isoform X2 [Salmo trutta]